MSVIDCRDVSVSYPRDRARTTVLDSLSLDIPAGEFVVVLGPNGSGKTTLLMVLAGLLAPDSGTISIGGCRPQDARVGLMLQNYSASLYPWLRNVDNIAFVLDGAHKGQQHKREYVRTFVAEMGLSDLPLRQYPYQCSGGQKQLVALARELIYQPSVLLLDEPFAALDYERRLQQQNYLLGLWERTRTTIVLVSHDVDDAVFLADRIVVLSKRPARVAATIDVTLPRPRTVEMQTGPDYAALRGQVLQTFLGVLRQ
jgi:NitT/TauT family transport system ATP-binding protein